MTSLGTPPPQAHRLHCISPPIKERPLLFCRSTSHRTQKMTTVVALHVEGAKKPRFVTLFAFARYDDIKPAVKAVVIDLVRQTVPNKSVGVEVRGMYYISNGKRMEVVGTSSWEACRALQGPSFVLHVEVATDLGESTRRTFLQGLWRGADGEKKWAQEAARQVCAAQIRAPAAHDKPSSTKLQSSPQTNNPYPQAKVPSEHSAAALRRVVKDLGDNSLFTIDAAGAFTVQCGF